MSKSNTITAQVAAPNITCTVVSEAGGQATIEVRVDTGGAEIDTARMEMLYDGAALSNPAVTIGSDFNTPGIDAGYDGSIVVPDGRTFLLQTYGINGATGTGDLAFATFVFDWTGDATTVTFNEAGSGIPGQGSLQILVGESTPLGVGSCPLGEPEPSATTVVDIVVASEDHTTLEDAVVAADLAGVLSDADATFTVFAPDDGTLTANGLDVSALTSDVLTNHVISGAAVMSGDITDGLTATTVAGNTLTFTLDGGTVRIDGLVDGLTGVVQVADLTADNGVVHSITFESPDEPPVLAGTISCTIIDNGDGTITVPVMVNTDGDEIDTIRMEMLYEGAALSNPSVTIGSDFNTPGIDAGFDGSVVVPDGRTFLLQTYGINGATASGDLAFATFMFDWTGDVTTITFNEVGSGIPGQGSLKILVGESSPLTVSSCSTIETDTPTPEPDTPTPEPDTPTPEPDTPTPVPSLGTISCTVTDNGDGTISVPVRVNTGGAEIDTIRMEMLYEAAALSNPSVTIGSDFNTPGIDAGFDGSIVVPDGRTFLLQTYGINGATASGDLAFATFMFDWTGDSTTITFNETDSGIPGQGSLQILVGESTPLTPSSCITPDQVVTPTPEPDTPTPEPDTPTAVPDTPTPTPIPLPPDPDGASVSGVVTYDDAEPMTGPVTGIDVNLLNDGGAVVETVQTDGGGNYSFPIAADDVGENYSVEFVIPSADGFAFSFVSGVESSSELPTGEVSGVTASILVESGDADTADAVVGTGFLASIVAGQVSELGGPKEGIEVTLLDSTGAVYDTMTTDAGGEYIFNIPAEGVEQNYTLSYVIPPLDVSGASLPVQFTEGIVDIVSVDENGVTVGISRLLEVPTDSTVINFVAYGAPTAVGLSNVTTLEVPGLLVMMGIVLLVTTVLFVKIRPTYTSSQ